MLDEASLAQTAPRARFTTFEPCGHPPHSALRLSGSLTIRRASSVPLICSLEASMSYGYFAPACLSRTSMLNHR